MKKVVLGEVCDFFNGGAWSDKEYVNEGIPVLKVTNCKSTGFQLDNLNYLSEKSREKYKKNNLIIGDVIVATVGSHPNLIESAAGRSCIVNSQVEGFYLNQNAVCIRTKDKRILSQKYLGYLCKCADFQHYIQSRGRGAANQMRIAISSIKEYSFTLPDFENQQYIADILSAYDDLIENNQKQIKLLEEAAQRLYKEWFVDLRFPGHENTKIVDGVPEGWKKNCAEKFFEITIGKTPPRTEKRCFTTGENGIPWVSIADMGNSGMFVLNTAENLTEDAIKQYNVKVIPKNTVLLSFKLTVGRVAIAPTDICTNEAIAHFKGRRECEREYTYFYLKNFHYDELGSTSSISKAVNSKIIKAMPFVMPSEKLLKEYSSKTKDAFDLIICKQKINNNLKIARDRMLHKLMSGEVEV